MILLYPAYDVLFLQPDRAVGWKQVPNLHWTWAGHRWYAADFSVAIETNPLGFRDIARHVPKPSRTTRIALLGDSFIEAVQVPFEKTAGRVLERRLNDAADHGPEPSRRHEVLNLGISNYGVGQYLLAWEEYVRQYDPDYVAIFVAGLHMRRTVSKHEFGAFSETRRKRLWIRPTFRLEGDSLILVPARDHAKFEKVQQELIRTAFNGSRIRKRRQQQRVTAFYAKKLLQRGLGLAKSSTGNTVDPASSPRLRRRPLDPRILAVNLKIIEELGQRADKWGSRLIVLDASRYFNEQATNLVGSLQELCARSDFGYIPLYAPLLKANEEGRHTRWTHDQHFNETGNAMVAEALQGWMIENANPTAVP